MSVLTAGFSSTSHRIGRCATRIDTQYLARVAAAVISFSFLISPPPPLPPTLLLLRERLCSPAYIKAKSTPLLPAYCGVQELEDPFPLSHIFSL